MSGHFESVVAFIRSIGIGVREAAIQRKTLVPGIDIVLGTLVVDRGAMCQSADLLHEAAHIALTRRDQRSVLDGTICSSAAEEISAIAWTWAAALHLGIAPHEVFHDKVISGNGPTLRENFAAGRYVGVPMLQYWGLTIEKRSPRHDDAVVYPGMIAWVRA
jgi:hypothetical protein